MLTMKTREYLDVVGAAEVLGMSQRAIRARIARRELPFRKVGSRVIIPRDELDRYIRALEGVTAAEAIRNVTA